MKFIHIADVHLGAVPDRGHPWSAKREEEIWTTFCRVLDEAVKREADLLLIAGDLFHRPPSVRELREADYLFGRLGSIQVVLIAGNHDHLGKDLPMTAFQWSDNVTFLDGESCECVCFEEYNTCIYGFSYYSQEITQALYDGIRPQHGGECNILLAHGGDEKHIPVNYKKLEKSGFDYVALGHIHKHQELIKDRVAYAGALEPIDVNDTGPHGYIFGELRNGKIHTQFVEFARREYIHLELTCDSQTTDFAMRERLEQEIQERGRENMYRVTISGYRSPETQWNMQSFMGLGNIVDIRDESRPDYDLEELYRIHKDDMIGRYMEKLLSEEETAQQTDPVRMRALYYGIHALTKKR